MQNSMVMFTFSLLQIFFLGRFSPKFQNCQFKLKLGNYTSSNYRIRWRCSLFLYWTKNTLFRKIWFKASKCSVSAEDWSSEYFEYAELNGGILFSILGWKYPSRENLVQKLKIVSLS